MKHFLGLLLLVMFAAGSAKAQTPEREYHFYAAPMATLTTLNSGFMTLPGISFGVQYKEYYAGLVGRISVNKVDGDADKNAGAKLDIFYGGVELGYKHTLSEKFSLFGSLIAAIGAVGLDPEPSVGNKRDKIGFLEPNVNIRYTISGKIGLTAGFGYRIMFKEGATGYEAGDFNGPAGSVGLVFGPF